MYFRKTYLASLKRNFFNYLSDLIVSLRYATSQNSCRIVLMNHLLSRISFHKNVTIRLSHTGQQTNKQIYFFRPHHGLKCLFFEYINIDITVFLNSMFHILFILKSNLIVIILISVCQSLFL